MLTNYRRRYKYWILYLDCIKIIQMLGDCQFRRPPKHFSLLYLDCSEVHYLSLKVSLLVEAGSQAIQGRLHLCSRSLVFEPSAICRPLLRLRYSSGVFLRALKNTEMKKAFKIMTVRRSQKEMKVALEKGAHGIAELLESEKEVKSYKKIYEASKTKSNETEDKICNCILIKSGNFALIQRKPISPYFVERSQHNLVFVLSKTTLNSRLIRFLRLYDQLHKTTDEDKLNRSIISATCDESVEELLQHYQGERLESANIIRCRRILFQGIQYGHIVLFQHRVMYEPLVNCPDNQKVQFTFREVRMIRRYRYLMQHIAIELWLYSLPHSVLFVLPDRMTRENVYRAIKDKAQKLEQISLNETIRMWSEGQITNLQYLNYLNVLGNRSYNDLSQYPIAPWVIHNYDSELDLRSAQMYRDLTKPVGALNKHRLKKLKDLNQIKAKSDRPPHLYSTHYSMPSYTCYYLLRKIPQLIIRLQSGVFNPSQRIFRCVQSAYYNNLNLAADFKELTPQFYGRSSDFLVNWEHLDMGSTPTGEQIDDVKLPKWAASAENFLLKMRAAFESDYVSAKLNDWVDLVFGYKQTGTHAVTADNTFYALTYEENCNFDKISTKVERQALEMQLMEFGQTPLQIFGEQHPLKKTRILSLGPHSADDKPKLIAKLQAAQTENCRLQRENEMQIRKFSKKINEKEELYDKHIKEKNKEVQKIRALIDLDHQALNKFQFKGVFASEQQKNIYYRQMEEILRIKEEENQKMNLIITGLRRQFMLDQSIRSNIDDQIEVQNDFLAD